ncbi:hypothetical protein [Sphingomonas sp. ZB1N12]
MTDRPCVMAERLVTNAETYGSDTAGSSSDMPDPIQVVASA